MRTLAFDLSSDYAYYLKGLVNFERGGTVLDVVSERDLSDFDKNLLLAAYRDFRLLIQRFPSSKYVADARKRMIYLRNELARADFKIASYYATRDAWVAVPERTMGVEQMGHMRDPCRDPRQGLFIIRFGVAEGGDDSRACQFR